MKEKYNEMSYLEKIEYLDLKIYSIYQTLENAYKDTETIDYIEEDLHKLMEIATIAKDDIELNDIVLKYISEIIEVTPRVVKREIDISILIAILNDICFTLSSERPENLKLGKLLLKMADNSDKIADLIGVSSLDFNNIMQKMGENTDKIADIIEFSKTYR